MRIKTCLLSGTALALIIPLAAPRGASTAEIEEITIIGTSPGAGLGLDGRKIPFAVRVIGSEDLEQAQSLDLSDFMNQNTPSAHINSAQNNPLQPDLLLRGFTASPLLGLPQGIAVYQNGIRVNEPLGDSVNWDLLPESAVSRLSLVSGANPLFGLNALGGALVLQMKDGFDFTGSQAEIHYGSWERLASTVESGGNNGALAYYANVSWFEEEGWRQLSDSRAGNFYGSLSWRNAELSSLNLSYQRGDSRLIGNGAAPAGLLAEQRDAVFTAPDITENAMEMLALEATHFIAPTLQLAGSAFWRGSGTDSFNGDASEFKLCEYHGGGRSLLEDAEELEGGLEESLGIELDEICAGEIPSVASYADLDELIEERAALAGLDAEDFELEDIIDELSGDLISDEAINNISNRSQDSRGFRGKLILVEDLFGRGNHFTLGFSYRDGKSDFDSVVELAELDPVTRSTEGRGTGTFVNQEATRVKTRTETASLFFINHLNLSERLTLTLGGRYSAAEVTLQDRSGERPELNGEHGFSRFNPFMGLSLAAGEAVNVYASYSQSSRVPTPIELACNEGVFALARQYALAEGDDPAEVDFECRLPNAFLADPPLDQVVTSNVEVGMRGAWNSLDYQLGLYRASNRDDIIFQTTGRATGLFANVSRTRRQGFEAVVSGALDRLDWFASYSFIEATFEDDFRALSPNHPNADAEGSIAVERGDRLPGIPASLLKAGGAYRLSDNFSVGLEAIYNAARVLRGDESNELDKVSGYALLNLRASYRLGDRLAVFARVSNVLNKDYENFGLLGEDPDEILPALADDRPIFLGAGAPRSALAGFRYRW